MMESLFKLAIRYTSFYIILVQVYCDMETDGGGWTVFQRRMDGSVDFDRCWRAYENGFGNLNFEFWLGLSKIHRLTKARRATELLVKLNDFEGNTVYAKYSTFSIGDSSTEYRLTIAGYSGTARDIMTNSNNMKFTTRDNGNDRYGTGGNCATRAKGGWWCNKCSINDTTNLNGVHHDRTGMVSMEEQHGIISVCRDQDAS